jgi:acetylglutamate kinase
VAAVNSENIDKILQAGFVPVFCAITHDGNGQLLNTNADTMASAIATAMSGNYESFCIIASKRKACWRM